MRRCLTGLLVLSGLSLAAFQDAPPISFDVASVKANHNALDADPPRSNFALGPGNVYVKNGGYFSAANQPFTVYFGFAYRLMANERELVLPQLPEWASTERFDIQGRSPGHDTKDEMRLMMRSLLAERFKLKFHYETRQVPVYAAVLAKPGVTGPMLQPHPAAATCSTTDPHPVTAADLPASMAKLIDAMPNLCGGLFPIPSTSQGTRRMGARDITMGFFVNSFSLYGDLGKPTIDRTELKGTYDIAMEWSNEDKLPNGEPAGPSFQEALKQQLGLKLESQKGPIQVMIIDHLERPAGN